MEEIEDRLDNLDDDNAAISNIIKRTYSNPADDDYDSNQRSKAGSKFAKSLKKMTSNNSFSKNK
jgi:hypothetical protein